MHFISQGYMNLIGHSCLDTLSYTHQWAVKVGLVMFCCCLFVMVVITNDAGHMFS